MRKITARQRQIIWLLLGVSEEITAAEIAGATGVSVRTVHREMDDIEESLRDFGLKLIKKSGKGIQLSGPETGLAELRLFLREEKPAEYSGEDRKVYELCQLLESEDPVKLFSLAHSLKVTVATISYDLDELEPWVRKFGLELVRRRGYGVEITGGEADKRRAICRLAAEHLDLSDLVGHTVHTDSSPVFSVLISMVGKSNLMDVENTLWDMEWKWTAELPEIVYMEMLLALAVTTRRIEIGRSITAEEAGYSRLSDHRNISGAEQFVHRLGEVLDQEIPKAEILYIAGLFDRVQESFSSTEFAYGDIELMEIVYRLTESIAKRTGIPFQSDRSLREGLIEHMDPALKRIREGTRIRNPLLGPIRKDYEYLFHMVRTAVEDIKLDLVIPDEEIGFLVMHFGASVERLNQLRRNVRAILVCASGLSSSRLLATRLAKEMPQIEILGNISWYEAARLPEVEYDLIISTIDLPLAKDRYIKISPLLTGEEIEKLLKYIQNTTLKEQETPVPGEPQDRGVRDEAAMDRLISYKGLLDEMVSLLERFRFYPLDNSGLSLSATLSEMLDLLNGTGVIGDADILLERLLERERMASQVIPDTGLALFHTRSSHIHISSLSLYRLNQPVLLEGDTEVRVILLMLAPRRLSKESLEVLSEISALLLNSELVKLLEERTESEIRRYLSSELLHFFENKI